MARPHAYMQSIVKCSTQFASMALSHREKYGFRKGHSLEPGIATRQVAAITWVAPFLSGRVFVLIIAFENKPLRQICEDENEAIEKLGELVADKLRSRLADLRAVDSVLDIPVGNPRKTEGPKCHCMSVDLCDGHRIVFCTNHVSAPVDQYEKVDWSKVSRVKILEIERDNG